MTRPTITRTEQVQKALRKGAQIETVGERGLLRLVDRKGVEMPAWQGALKTAQEKESGGGK